MDLANPKQTRPTLGSYLSDQTFVFTGMNREERILVGVDVSANIRGRKR